MKSGELGTAWSAGEGPVPRLVVRPVQRFLRTEIASGIVLLVAAVVALVWANSPAADSYQALWETPFAISLGGLTIAETLGHWVNDLLMALFFFVVGLEIKRELVHGELRDPKAALLPLLCALGGMVVPALIYTAINLGGPGVNGWGIPMATDIAFAIGILALVGSRAPAGLKVFLLTLAIVDDIGAIMVIAAFYSDGVSALWLAVAALTVVAIVVLKRLQVRPLAPYVVAAAVLWFAVYSSGVHPTIAGVTLGLLTPARPLHAARAAAQEGTRRLARVGAGEGDDEDLLAARHLSAEAVSPLVRLERALHPWTAFLVLPLFALANAGVVLSGDAIGGLLTDRVALGVVAGLVLGKPLGIMGAAAIALATGRARLPRGVGWLEMLGVSALAGVGFTVSIFIAGLAFTDAALDDAAKVGILAASLLAGVIGFVALAARDAAKSDAA